MNGLEKIIAAIIAVPAVFLVVVLLSLVLSWPLELAWNYVMPYLFGLKELTLMQAFALSFVSSTLLKSSTGSSK